MVLAGGGDAGKEEEEKRSKEEKKRAKKKESVKRWRLKQQQKKRDLKAKKDQANSGIGEEENSGVHANAADQQDEEMVAPDLSAQPDAKDDISSLPTNDKSPVKTQHTIHSRHEDLRAFFAALSPSDNHADYKTLTTPFLSTDPSPLSFLVTEEFTIRGLLWNYTSNKERLGGYLKEEVGLSEVAWWALERLLARGQESEWV